MKNIMKAQQSKIVFVMAVILAALGGSAVNSHIHASIPDQNGKINACYRTKGGDLRVLDTATTDACSNQETAINWDKSAGTGNAEAIKVIANANGQLDTARSQNVVSTTLATHPSSEDNVLCVDTTYSPSFLADGSGYFRYDNADSALQIDTYCGTQYDMMVHLNVEYRALAF